MFWRILGRELKASRTRLLMALLVVVSGAVVVSALLNLQLDIDGKLARAFRVYGANVLVTPGRPSTDQAVMPGSIWRDLARRRDVNIVAAAPYLYVVARVRAAGTDVILAGTTLDRVRSMNSWWKVDGRWPAAPGEALVGANVAREAKLAPGRSLDVEYGRRSETLAVAGVVTAGGPEDNQIFADLSQAQQLAGLADRVSVVQLSVGGPPGEIRTVISRLASSLAGVTVQPIPEFAAAEVKLAGKIRMLVRATVVLILSLTVLGVLASLAALAADRRPDVGIMKAIGGRGTQIVRLFLVEVGLLSVCGALVGCMVGLPLSDWMSWRIFGAGVTAQWEVVPLVVGLMLGAALAGSLPLSLLGRLRPAVILRGEGWTL